MAPTSFTGLYTGIIVFTDISTSATIIQRSTEINFASIGFLFIAVTVIIITDILAYIIHAFTRLNIGQAFAVSLAFRIAVPPAMLGANSLT